jgi:Flp pilus assembly protein TadG
MMMRSTKPRLLPRLYKFLTSRRRTGLLGARQGVAGLEFALILPLFISMVTGFFDISNGYVASLRVNLCAQAIDQIATAEAAGSTTANTINLSQISAAASAAYAYLPSLLSASPPAFGIVISAVAMTPTVSGCTSGCTYTAHVAWSGNYQGTLGTLRPCDTVQGTSIITQTTDTGTPSATTLPSDDYSAASLLVVDVTYTYTPTFFSFLTSSFNIQQSAYFAPRTGIANNWIQYVFVAPDSTTLCAGYPSA